MTARQEVPLDQLPGLEVADGPLGREPNEVGAQQPERRAEHEVGVYRVKKEIWGLKCINIAIISNH